MIVKVRVRASRIENRWKKNSVSRVRETAWAGVRYHCERVNQTEERVISEAEGKD